MATRNNTNIRLNFTGNNELDRYNIFNYIIENFTPDQTEAEILVLAATFLANSYQEIVNEIRANPDMLVPVCLYLMVEEKISIIRRADIGNALVHYSDNYAKTLEQKANKKPLFNFTNEYEKLLFSRLSQKMREERLYPLRYTTGFKDLRLTSFPDVLNTNGMFNQKRKILGGQRWVDNAAWLLSSAKLIALLVVIPFI